MKKAVDQSHGMVRTEVLCSKVISIYLANDHNMM